MKPLKSYPLCLLVTLSLAGNLTPINASPFHPKRNGRFSTRYAFNRSLRNRRPGERAEADSSTLKKREGDYPTGKYTAFDLSFASTPFHVWAAAPQAIFNYNYTNIPGDYQYNSGAQWNTWNQPTPSGAFKMEIGNYNRFFVGLGIRFWGGVGNSLAAELEIGYNYALTSNPRWKFRPSISYTYVGTNVWFPEEIDNHEKDAIIFGHTFPYRYHTRHGYGYSESIQVGVRNENNGVKLKLGIAHDFGEGVSLQLNVGYNFYFANNFELYAQSKATHNGTPLDTPGLDFTLGSTQNPNQLFNYNGMTVDFTVSLRIKDDLKHHHHYRYYR